MYYVATVTENNNKKAREKQVLLLANKEVEAVGKYLSIHTLLSKKKL